MTKQLPPRLVAFVDQERAQLRDLVDQARAHVADGCDFPGSCPGPVLERVINLGRGRALSLLLAAIVDLAKRPSRTQIVESVAGTLLARHADIITNPDGSAEFVDEQRWEDDAEAIVDELTRVGLIP
jgi:hypothetical protein